MPVYNASGYFSIEVHGGPAPQNMMNNMIHPFERRGSSPSGCRMS